MRQTSTQLARIDSNHAVVQALGVKEILAQVRLIQEVMSKVMVENEHYGKVPGCGDKKTLLQPGAQKLTMTFRLAPQYEIQEVNLPREHKEYRVTCTLKSITSGCFVGQGVGCCSTMESKYRWRGGARKCPQCGKEAIIKGKADFGGGWLCWAKKDGCGFKWPDGAPEIESQSVDKVENDNPADCFNTVLKMAKKRAFVDATITATAASDIFTQDIGDAEGEETPPAPESVRVKPATPAPEIRKYPKVPDEDDVSYETAAIKPLAVIAFPTEDSRKKMIAQLEPSRGLATEYFVKAGYLLPTEALEDLPLRFVPASVGQMRLLAGKIAEFEAGNAATPAFAPHIEPEAAPKARSKPVEVPREAVDDSTAEEPWRSFPMPWGARAGQTLAELDKRYLFGLWANYTVETDYQGKPKKPEAIAKDTLFRQMLDDAGSYYAFKKD